MVLLLTGHIIITFTLALAFNLGFVFLGLVIHKLHFFKLFVPSGVPTVLLPLIVVIEIVSYFIRTFSLSLTFICEYDGRTYIVTNFSFVCCGFLRSFGISGFSSNYSICFGICSNTFRGWYAFLQAYVFTILLCIYANDSLNLH